MEWKLSGKQIVLLTVIVANMLMLALIWAKQEIVIPPAADTTVVDVQTPPTVEYEYELEGVSQTDGWRIEHYQQYEKTVDETGNVVSKKPTEQTQHLKYWTGD